MSMKKIRLMLVVDYDVARVRLRTFLQTQADFDVVAEAPNGEEAIRIASFTHPDIILMDVPLPGMDSRESTRRLRALGADYPVLALTVHDDKQGFLQMLAVGATGYISKQSLSDELVAAVHTIVSGNIYLQPALVRWLLEDYQRLIQKADLEPIAGVDRPEGSVIGLEVLSLRERQVLQLIAQGYNNQETGKSLELSPKTIARHRERIMSKLNMHSRIELVKFAIRSGLVRLD
jgi:two-component system response regulator NreC